jgi:hypothetical protein
MYRRIRQYISGLIFATLTLFIFHGLQTEIAEARIALPLQGTDQSVVDVNFLFSINENSIFCFNNIIFPLFVYKFPNLREIYNFIYPNL